MYKKFWRLSLSKINALTRGIISILNFLIHRYPIKEFYPLYAPDNLKALLGHGHKDFLDATLDGRLLILRSTYQKIGFTFKNILLLGAPASHLEKVVLYTFIALTLELNNPFEKRILMQFLHRKIALLRRILTRLETINGKKWDKQEIDRHLSIFLMRSLVQYQVIAQMERAVLKQKEPAIIKDAKLAIKKGLHPILSIHGASGAYWMRGTDRSVVGLFKPFDEEIHAPNNPVGGALQGALGQRRTRIGCRVGEAAHHEVGAFLVDSFFGFGIVPKTCYASFKHQTFFLNREDRLGRKIDKIKHGSFQEYVDGFIPLGDLPDEEFPSIPMDEFQLLVLLDVIIGNCDRNAGNLLIGDQKIAAIDHGLSFPDVPCPLSFWYWDILPQGKEPLYPAMVDLLNNFPFDALGWKLRKKCFISFQAIERMRERVTLFREGVLQGLSPVQMEELFSYENLCAIAELNVSLQEKVAEIVQDYKKKFVT